MRSPVQWWKDNVAFNRMHRVEDSGIVPPSSDDDVEHVRWAWRCSWEGPVRVARVESAGDAQDHLMQASREWSGSR